MAGKKNLAILKPWFGILGFQMNLFFWGVGSWTFFVPSLQTATQKERRRIIVIMGRSPVRLKEVVYGVSSNKVEIMGSLARDALSATAKKIGGGWFDVTVFGIAPLVGTVMCVVLCVVVVVVSCCVFSSGFWWCSFFLCGRGLLVRGWRRLVAFFLSLPSVVPSRRLSARREAGK